MVRGLEAFPGGKAEGNGTTQPGDTRAVEESYQYLPTWWEGVEEPLFSVVLAESNGHKSNYREPVP